MAIIFKRKSDPVAAPVADSTEDVQSVAPPPKSRLSLLKTRVTDVPSESNTTEPEAELPKPKTILKFGGSKSPTAAAPGKTPPAVKNTERQQKALVDSGLMASDELKPVAYDKLMIGDRVIITNSMFPWVKHYKPGDSGVISHISSNVDPLCMDDGNGHQLHVLKIDMPKEASRKGGTAALFRWEFSKASEQLPLIEEETT